MKEENVRGKRGITFETDWNWRRGRGRRVGEGRYGEDRGVATPLAFGGGGLVSAYLVPFPQILGEHTVFTIYGMYPDLSAVVSHSIRRHQTRRRGRRGRGVGQDGV